MKTITRLVVVLAAALALVAPATNAATAAPTQPTPAAAPAVAQLSDHASPDEYVVGVPAGWVEWDGFLITTKANCESRKNYLITTYHLIRSRIGCFEVVDVCGCTIGWVIFVDSGASPRWERDDQAVA